MLKIYGVEHFHIDSAEMENRCPFMLEMQAALWRMDHFEMYLSAIDDTKCS